MGLWVYPQVQKQYGPEWNPEYHPCRLTEFSNLYTLGQVGGGGWMGEKGIILVKIKTYDIHCIGFSSTQHVFIECLLWCQSLLDIRDMGGTKQLGFLSCILCSLCLVWTLNYPPFC